MTAAAPKPPFADGKRLARVRCEHCGATGRCAVWPEYGIGSGVVCPKCQGRKFVWVAVEGEAP